MVCGVLLVQLGLLGLFFVSWTPNVHRHVTHLAPPYEYPRQPHPHPLFFRKMQQPTPQTVLYIFNVFIINYAKSVWLSKSLQKDTNIRIFNACVKSVLLYGCETWLVTNEIHRKIQTFVNRCLRYILRIWWPNIISNKDLWKVTGQQDINLEIRKRKFRWIGHTLRKEDGEVPKAVLLWNPHGNRKRGRPKNGWRISVIKEAGRSWNELRFLAADRQQWKGLIDNLCS